MHATLKDDIENGLIQDIFKFEVARGLYVAIARRRDQLCSRDLGNYALGFMHIQHALVTEAAVAVSRMHDRPSNRYPTRCVRGIAHYLSQHADSLGAPKEKLQTRRLMEQYSVPEKVLSALERGAVTFPRTLSQHIVDQLDTLATEQTLSSLKELRDKKIAHNERTDAKPSVPWAELEKLVGVGKLLSGVLGWAYFDVAWAANGEHFLSYDAAMPANALDRMFASLFGANDDRF